MQGKENFWGIGGEIINYKRKKLNEIERRAYI